MGINRAAAITKVVQDDYDNGNQTIIVTREDGSSQTEIWQWNLNTEDFYNHGELARGKGFKSDAERYADIEKHAKQFKSHRNYTKEIDGLEKRHGKPIGEILDSLADAAKAVNTDPSEGQKESGNYKKGHTSVHGLPVCIENPKGSIRSGKNKQGKEWQSTMNAHYGYFKKTIGADGDEIDVFFGSTAEDEKPGIFVISQNDEKGAFDEHKVMFGYADIESAKKAYLGNYDKGWTGLGSIKAVSLNDFKQWLKSGRTKAIMDALGEVKMTTQILDSRDDLWAARLKRLIKDGIALLKSTDAGIEARIKARGDVMAAYDELSSEEVEQASSTARWESNPSVQDVMAKMRLKNANDTFSLSSGMQFGESVNKDPLGLFATYGTQDAIEAKVKELGDDITPADIDALVSFLQQKTEDYSGLSPIPTDNARNYAGKLLDQKARLEGVDDLPITEKDIEFYTEYSSLNPESFVESDDYPFTGYEAAKIYMDRVAEVVHARRKAAYEASDIHTEGLKLADMLSSDGFTKASDPGINNGIYSYINAGAGRISVSVDQQAPYGQEEKEDTVYVHASYSESMDASIDSMEHNVKTGKLADIKNKILAFADQFNTVVNVASAPDYGSKYDSELRDGKDIAKVLRKTFKDAAKSGDIPKEVKLSIRSSYNSIDIDIKALPDSIPVFSDEFIQWEVEKEDRWGSLPGNISRHSTEMQALTRFIKDHANAYNYDRSDTMTDYFDTNFYLSVRVDHDLESRVKKDAIAAYSAGKASEIIEEPEVIEEPAPGPESEPQQEPDPMKSRIEALRTMPIAEYETAIDPLIEELQAAGRLEEFEAELTEIDESMDSALEEMVTKNW